MSPPSPAPGAMAVVERLLAAMNEHDLDAAVACFAADYVSEQPVHPGREFHGADVVRRNWASILAPGSDFRAELLRAVASGDEVWGEWRWRGSTPDGSGLHMRGTAIFVVTEGLIRRGTLYLEPVHTPG